MSVTKIITVRRGGFTLVELLVVIAIIGVLMGLLMPALVNARLTALQTTCANNERELAQAIIIYDNENERLPYIGRLSSVYATWQDQILEQLGLGKENELLYDAYSNHSGKNKNFAGTPCESYFSPFSIKQFKCPVSDSAVAGFNYVLNGGDNGCWPDSQSSSPSKVIRGKQLFYFYENKSNSYTKSSISTIFDGGSSTILVSEKCYKKIPGNSNTDKKTHEYWDRHAYKESSTSNDDNYLALGKGPSFQYFTFYTASNHYPSSRHAQINNMAFADGSVRSVSKAIKNETCIQLMYPNDVAAGISSTIDDPNYK